MPAPQTRSPSNQPRRSRGRRSGNLQLAGKVRKWGNSAAILLPQAVTHAGKIPVGTKSQFEVRDDGVLIRPAVRRRQTIEELLDGVTPENVARVPGDKPVGSEVF